MINPYSELFAYIAIVADLATLITIVSGLMTFLNNRLEAKSWTFFKVSLWAANFIKITILLLLLFVLLIADIAIHDILISMLESNSRFTFLIKISVVTFIFIITLFTLIFLGSAIWYLSWNNAKAFLQQFLPQTVYLNFVPQLTIHNATYGTDDHFITVTSELRRRIKNNRLYITSSNDIAGDPHWGYTKFLKIKYGYGLESYDVEAVEGETLDLPRPEDILSPGS